MLANASEGTKVLPIARISIKKTGMFRTTPERIGKRRTGRQPPSRFRNANKAGAYASEKRSAVTINEVAGTVCASVELNVWPCAIENVSMIESSASNHEPSEIETSFIGETVCLVLCVRGT